MHSTSRFTNRSQAPASIFLIRNSDDEEIGPFHAEEIKEWMLAGQYDFFTPARRVSEQKWKMLGSFVEFSGAHPEKKRAGATGVNAATQFEDIESRDAHPSTESPFPYRKHADAVEHSENSQSSDPEAHWQPSPENIVPPPLSEPSGQSQPVEPAPVIPPDIPDAEENVEESGPAESAQSRLKRPPEYALPLWARIVWIAAICVVAIISLGLSTYAIVTNNPDGMMMLAYSVGCIIVLIAIPAGLARLFWWMSKGSNALGAAGLLLGTVGILAGLPFVVGEQFKLDFSKRQTQQGPSRLEMEFKNAMDKVLKNVKEQVDGYAEARKTLDVEQMLNFTHVRSVEDLKAKRANLDTLIQKKYWLENAWPQLPIHFREEADKYKLSFQYIESVSPEFMSSIEKYKAAWTPQAEEDSRKIYLLDQIYKLLETHWGNWGSEGGRVYFKDSVLDLQYKKYTTDLNPPPPPPPPRRVPPNR